MKSYKYLLEEFAINESKKIAIIFALLITAFSSYLNFKNSNNAKVFLNSHINNISYLIQIGNLFEINRVVKKIEKDLNIVILIKDENEKLIYGNLVSNTSLKQIPLYSNSNQITGYLFYFNNFNLVGDLIFILISFLTTFLFFKKIILKIILKNTNQILSPISSFLRNDKWPENEKECELFFKSTEGNSLLKLFSENENVKSQKAFNDAVLRVVHDLKSPIAALKSLESLIFNKNATLINEKKFFILALKRIEDILNTLLTENRENQKLSTISSVYLWTNDIIEEFKQTHKDKIKKHSLSIVFNSGDIYQLSNPKSVFILETEYKRIVSNLINNSFESIFRVSKNIITIKINVIDNYFNFEIEDTGSGICPSQLIDFKNDIFYSTKIEGNGIGLKSIKQKLHQLNGKFEIFSKLEMGTKIKFNLPLT